MPIGRCLIALFLVLVAAVSARAATVPFPKAGQAICSDAGGKVIDCADAGQAGAGPPSSSARVISIWGGARHLIVLKSGGTVWDWGYNLFGKLGDNTVSTGSDLSNDRVLHHFPIPAAMCLVRSSG